MNASELDYELPNELIAQRPLERRDDSRLLVYSRTDGAIRHRVFRDLWSQSGETEQPAASGGFADRSE